LAGYDPLVVKKTTKAKQSQRGTDRRKGRFALLPARDEVVTSAQVQRLAEMSEFTSQRQAPDVATTIRSLRKGRFVLDADFSDVIGDGRD
jgi:hypothetical protein